MITDGTVMCEKDHCVPASPDLMPPTMRLVISPAASTTWLVSFVYESCNRPFTTRTAMCSDMLTVMKPDTLPCTPMRPVISPDSRLGTAATPTQWAEVPHMASAFSTDSETA